MAAIAWPNGKAFAFTIFDDTDSQTLDRCRTVYSLLSDLGLRTTKSVWVLGPTEPTDDPGANCEDPAYLAWIKTLQQRGFEIGYHMASATTAHREQTIRALDIFHDQFGTDPFTMANHYASREAIYFGEARLSSYRRLLYNLVTGFRKRGHFRGHVQGDPLFWGDVCRQRIRYVRNFTFPEINTLKVCPWMPYHDADRPFVNSWFASCDGAQESTFVQRLSEANQDRLEAEGGACIMYTHFGLGFVSDRGRLSPRFRQLMERISEKNGWFVPVCTLLDHLLELRPRHVLTDSERATLERRWLAWKLRSGSG